MNTTTMTTHPNLCYRYEGNGPCVVFIMGIGAQLIHWPDEFCQHFIDAGYSVLRFDNRDAGLSKLWENDKRLNIPLLLLRRFLGLKITAQYNLEDMADDVDGLLTHLNIEEAHVVGISMGSMIAQIFASKYASRTKSLSLFMSNTGEIRTLVPKYKALKALISIQKTTDRKEAQDNIVHLFSVIGSPKYPMNEKRLRELGGLAYDRGRHPRGFARQLSATLASGNRSHWLSQITCPVLIIHGSNDPLVHISAGKRLKELLPQAQSWWVEGMGHDLPQALWKEFADKIIKLAK
jgi:pimeloyl-ACP methyl ester carboxylesterase